MLKSRPMHVNPAAPPHSSFVSPLLFGRSTQLETLRSALERTRGGLGGTVLVTGDAGVGKSRLIATARAEALENGFQVLEAGCFEPDASVPYAPLLELLAPTAVDMATAAAELAGFVADPNGEPEQERHRLFVALTQYFAGLADAQPLLLIVEDIHWCDETSLQFLRYLARHIAARRIGLLLSYRVDADKTAPNLDHAVAELEQARLAIEVRVNPLSRADVELMAGAILSPPHVIASGVRRCRLRADGGQSLLHRRDSGRAGRNGRPAVGRGVGPAHHRYTAHPAQRARRRGPPARARQSRPRNEWHVWGQWLGEGLTSPSCSR